LKFLRASLFFATTVLIYLGVPLLGWGLGDLDGFFSLAPRLGYSIVVGLFGLAVGIQAYASTQGIRGGRGEAGKFVLRQRVVRIVLLISLYLALFAIPNFDRGDIGAFHATVTIRWLGVACSALGYALIFFSGVALGRQYSPEVTIQNDHQLITSGVYRYIRHPRYFGIIALAVGVSFVFRSWIGLIACLVCCGILLFRIKDEETLLHMMFGQEWEAYCQRSWRLIPYIF